MMLPNTFQNDCAEWAIDAFGGEIMSNVANRRERFIEEAIELFQSVGGTLDDLRRVMTSVYRKLPGRPTQEVGGVATTLAVLCEVLAIDLNEAALLELNRIQHLIPEIREREARKIQAKERLTDEQARQIYCLHSRSVRSTDTSRTCPDCGFIEQL